ncbi:MAG: hypothetical protein ACREXW_01895 [Gammaproteobacteria bacterium]
MVQVPKARCIVQNSQEVSDICATGAADLAIVLVLIGAGEPLWQAFGLGMMTRSRVGMSANCQGPRVRRRSRSGETPPPELGLAGIVGQ